MTYQVISKNYLNISMAQQLLHFWQFYLLQMQLYFWNYPEELKIQKNIWKHSLNIQKIFTRNEKRKHQKRYENSNRQYEKRILCLKGQTLNQLQLKHPEGKETSQEILLTYTPETIHPIKFESFVVEKKQKAAVKIQGGSRPSGMEEDGWRRI